jgi:hypothetical protein
MSQDRKIIYTKDYLDLELQLVRVDKKRSGKHIREDYVYVDQHGKEHIKTKTYKFF